MAAEPRLDPVRWRRPGRSALIRLGTVAGLIVVAAALVWSATAPPVTSSASTPSSGGPAGDGASTPSSGRPAGLGMPRGSGTPPPRTAAVTPPASGVPPGPQSGSGVPPADGARPAVPPGTVGVPIRLAEPAALALLRPGDRVQLLRMDDDGATKVSDAALVLVVHGADDPVGGGLLVALTPGEAQKAVTRADRGFAVLLSPD
jgi:hypothetical protein